MATMLLSNKKSFEGAGIFYEEQSWIREHPNMVLTKMNSKYIKASLNFGIFLPLMCNTSFAQIQQKTTSLISDASRWMTLFILLIY